MTRSLFRQLRDADALKGKCCRCEFRELCGGSRARAYALASDPSCPYKPASSDRGLSRARGGELTVSRRIVTDREAFVKLLGDL